MFIWDFVANPVMESILDWFYSQMVGFLGAFFAQMGNMGVELFDLSWVRSVVRFFSQLGWALFAVSVVVSAFECGIEYASAGQSPAARPQRHQGLLCRQPVHHCARPAVRLSVSLQGTPAAWVKAGAQSKMMELLEPDLTEEELAVYKRGRNAHSPTMAKHATMADYRRATGFEALMGYLYLKEDYSRIVELVRKGIPEENL